MTDSYVALDLETTGIGAKKEKNYGNWNGKGVRRANC